MPILKLQVLTSVLGVGLGIVVFDEGTGTANQKKFHQFLPVLLTLTALKCLDTPNEVFVLLSKLALTTNLADVGFGTNAQIGVIIDEQAQLAAQILVLLVIGCSRQQQHLAILFLNKVSDVAIACALTVTKIVAFIDNNQFVVSCMIHINGLCHRHDVAL